MVELNTRENSRLIVTAVPTAVYIRANRAEQDRYVIDEVITRDTYRLRNMKQRGFEPETIVSIGSHIGTFEVIAHALWPEARIVSVEPNKESFAILQRNAPFASAYNVAITYKTQGIFCDNEVSTGGGFISTKEEFEHIPEYDSTSGLVAEKIEHGSVYHIADENIDRMTFEDLIRAEHLSKIDLLKLDCEGGEWGIIEHLPIPGLDIRYLVGEWHGVREFAGRRYHDFVKAASAVLPHLTFHGPRPEETYDCPWGPFFSFPDDEPMIDPDHRPSTLKQGHIHTPFLKRVKRWLIKRIPQDE